MKFFNQILLFYIFSTFLFFLIYSFGISSESLPIFIYHSIVSFCSGILFLIYNNKKKYTYSSLNLQFIVGFFSFVLIICNNLISYIYNDNFFVFNQADALEYHNIALGLVHSDKDLHQVLNSLGYTFLNFGDYGMIYFTYFLYNFVESNLFVNCIFWIIGLFSVKYLFLISKNFMDSKYAFLCALVYGCSSFLQWFNSSGLKESFMVFLVIWSFYFFYEIIKLKVKKKIYYVYLLIPILLLIFFRPVVTVFIITSMILGYLLIIKLDVKKLFIIFISLLGLSFFLDNILSELEAYTGGNINNMIENLESEDGMIKGGSLVFNYFVNIFSGFFGPFPSYNTDKNLLLSFFAPGLTLKVLLGFVFIFSLQKIIKNKYMLISPLIIFFLIEVLSLIFVLEVLELRKGMPHFFIFYIIIFYGLYQLNFIKNKFKHLTYNLLFMVIFACLIVYWNQR